ncbi:MAG TPA: type IV pilus modification protein PilV [Rhodanobacteraceae bacterium]
MKPRTCRVPRAQAGVGLIEVLIAVLVVSIGFLGVAALQAMTLSTNNSAMARSMATVASYSILDAMRMDRANALGGSYNKTVAANACPAADATLAGVQLNQWCQQLGHDLGATATTTGKVDCLTSGDCTITITFNDSRSGAEGTSSPSSANLTVVTKAQL